MVTLDLPVPTPPADAAPPVVPLQTEPLGIDGLVVRPLDPGTDGPRLRAMCPRVSEQSRYQRFFSGIGYLSDSLLALLLDVDHERREALVALQGDEIVAVARYATTTAAPVEADISLLVVDDLQRHGIAKELLRRLEQLAGQRGIRTLTASVLGENRQARGLVLAAHPHARGHFERGSYAYRMEVAAPVLQSA